MRRSAAQALLFFSVLMGSIWTSACLAPPEGRLPPMFSNYPPEIDPGSASPREAKFIVGRDTCNPRLSVFVRDEDLDDLTYRCVLNNRTSDGRVAFQTLNPIGGQGSTAICFLQALDFPEDLSHNVTLAITDGPGFVVSSTQAGEFDFTEALPDPDTGEDRAVTTVSWTVVRNDGGECIDE